MKCFKTDPNGIDLNWSDPIRTERNLFDWYMDTWTYQFDIDPPDFTCDKEILFVPRTKILEKKKKKKIDNLLILIPVPRFSDFSFVNFPA